MYPGEFRQVLVWHEDQMQGMAMEMAGEEWGSRSCGEKTKNSTSTTPLNLSGYRSMAVPGRALQGSGSPREEPGSGRKVGNVEEFAHCRTGVPEGEEQ